MRERKSSRLVIAALLCLFALLSPVFGQAVSGFPTTDLLPPRPNNHVLDNAGLYLRNSEALRTIDNRLQGLQENYRFKIYVVIESVVMGSNPVELAARLEKAWLPDGDGLVIVYEVDSRAFGVGRPYDVAFKADAQAGPQIPSFISADSLERIHKQLDIEQAHQPMDSPRLLERLTALLTDECARYLESVRNSDKNTHTLRLAGIFLGIMCGLGLLILLMARFFRRKEERDNRTYRFPAVSDEQRLGAPFGAKVSARAFKEPASSDRR